MVDDFELVKTKSLITRQMTADQPGKKLLINGCANPPKLFCAISK